MYTESYTLYLFIYFSQCLLVQFTIMVSSTKNNYINMVHYYNYTGKRKVKLDLLHTCTSSPFPGGAVEVLGQALQRVLEVTLMRREYGGKIPVELPLRCVREKEGPSSHETIWAKNRRDWL